MIPRCKECQNAKMQDMNGRPNRWFLRTPRSKGLRQLSCRYNDLQRRKALNRDND